MLLEALKALVIGVVEGITEWLPISSTGHMILVDEFIKLDKFINQNHMTRRRDRKPFRNAFNDANY